MDDKENIFEIRKQKNKLALKFDALEIVLDNEECVLHDALECINEASNKILMLKEELGLLQNSDKGCNK